MFELEICVRLDKLFGFVLAQHELDSGLRWATSVKKLSSIACTLKDVGSKSG